MATIKRENIRVIPTPVVLVDPLTVHAPIPPSANRRPEQSLLSALSSFSFSGPSANPSTSLDHDDDEAAGASDDMSDAEAEAALSIAQYHPALARQVLGEKGASHALVMSESGKSRGALFFHAGCTHVSRQDGLEEVWCTSRPLEGLAGQGRLPVGVISKITLHRPPPSTRSASEVGAEIQDDGDGDPDPREGDDVVFRRVEWQKLRSPPSLALPAGTAPFRQGVLYCAQGSLGEHPSAGLFYMPRGMPPQPLVTGFCGREFNSPWGLAVERRPHQRRDDATGGGGGGMESGDAKPDVDEEELGDVVWFTDPTTGFAADTRPQPALPRHLYRLDTSTGSLRAMADNLSRPRGVAISHDGKSVYIADGSAIYVHDIHHHANSTASPLGREEASLGPRRLFSHVLRGTAKGLLCDERGNVYAGCGDGVGIFSEAGGVLGTVRVPGAGGVVGLAWGECGRRRREMFACAGRRLWVIDFGGRLRVE